MEISAKTISKKSLFNILFKSIGLGLLLFSLLMGILSIFGFETVTWNEEHITGIMGLVTSIFIGLFLSVFFTAFMWLLGVLGLWVNSKFSSVTIVFKQVTKTEN